MTESVPMIPLRQVDLDQTYKPIFQEFEENGGIPCDIVRDKLCLDGNDDAFSREELDSLLRDVDKNRDNILTYDEFSNLVEQTRRKGKTLTKLTCGQRTIRLLASSVTPPSKLKEELDTFKYCIPPPIFIIVISIVEMVLFIVYAELTGSSSRAPIKSPLIYNPVRRYEAWRYLTYMFVHANIGHLVGNLVFQLVTGVPLELVHKGHRVLGVYMLGVLAGSLVTSVVDPKIYLCGASAGCYSLIGAHFAYIIMNWKDMTHDWWQDLDCVIRVLLGAPLRITVLLCYMIPDTAYAIYSRYNPSPGAVPVAYAAHFAGFGAGLLMGVVILKNYEVFGWEEIIKYTCLAVFLGFIVFAVFWNAFYPEPYYYKPDWTKCCPAIVKINYTAVKP